MNWNKCIFRFLSIEIQNVKNIGNGKLSVNGFTEKKGWSGYNCEKADVLGIYGQNGSGKTSVIDALIILKLLISGEVFYNQERNENYLSNFITLNKNSIHLSATFLISDETESNIIEYDVTIAAKNKVEFYIDKENFYVHPLNSVKSIGKIEYTVDSPTLIEPKSLHKALDKDSKDNIVTMKLCNLLNKSSCTSFIFNRQKEKIENLYNIDEVFNYIKYFQKYMISNFIVVPQDFKYREEEYSGFQIFSPQSLSSDKTEKASAYTKGLDTVINSIIPDLHLSLKILGQQLSKNGEIENVVEFVSNRNDLEIPLRYESEGIKKLISILDVLILMHNNSDIFVAIDNLDTNIFEYLLCEILSMLSESGQGQLLFTSHNLYPLEILNKDSIYFTTTNKDNRFIHFKYVKPNHNLRDQYLKTIRLGGQDEDIYIQKKTGKIRLAFHSVGK